MVKFLSPGTYVLENDNSEYAPTIDSSIVGVVGFASKGPTNTATLITSTNQLIDTFGEPSEDIAGQGLEGCIEILEATNKVVFIRCADDTSAVNASAVMQMGACPALTFSAGAYGVTNDLYLEVQVTDEAGVNQFTTAKQYSIPAGTLTSGDQAAALKKIIGGSLDSADVGLYYDASTAASGFLVGNWAGSGASLNVSAYSDSGFTTGVAILQKMDQTGEADGSYASAVTAEGMSFGKVTASGLSYVIESQYPGAGYNEGTKANGDTSGNSAEVTKFGNGNDLITINDKGAARENFKVSLVATQNFVEDVINTGITNVTSDIIKGQLYFSGAPADSPVGLTSFVDKVTGIGIATVDGTLNGGTDFLDGSPRFSKFIEGTTSLASGDNGIPAAEAAKDTALIGDSAAEPKTGMQSLDNDSLDISIAIVPGITTQATQNALITLAAASTKMVALVAPPFGVGSVQNAIDWHNGQGGGRTAAISSNYAGIFWPWVQTFSVYDAMDRWYDPSIFAARQMAYTDQVSDPWFAAAGTNRGKLTKPTDVEVSLNQGDRDSLYSGGNVINPITKFIRSGITIWGNRTAQRTPSSLDRLNVRRMMIVVRKILLQVGEPFVFAPNDEFTWEKMEAAINPFLDDIRVRRGITEFKVTCDATVNTPARVDRNELWCKIQIKPTKTAEMIVFEVNLTNQSANLGG